jgi:hypothetical protein
MMVVLGGQAGTSGIQYARIEGIGRGLDECRHNLRRRGGSKMECWQVLEGTSQCIGLVPEVLSILLACTMLQSR